jgi:hypothetical protein
VRERAVVDAEEFRVCLADDRNLYLRQKHDREEVCGNFRFSIRIIIYQTIIRLQKQTNPVTAQ